MTFHIMLQTIRRRIDRDKPKFSDVVLIFLLQRKNWLVNLDHPGQLAPQQKHFKPETGMNHPIYFYHGLNQSVITWSFLFFAIQV